MRLQSDIMFIPDTRAMTRRELKQWSRRWPNFHPYELDSRDWSLKINTRAMDALQRIRTAWGKPMRITSAYRSPAHNAAVGGVQRSQHLNGCALDIVIADADEGRSLEALAREFGATGIGRYPSSRFIHIDWREGRPAAWGNWS